VTDSNRRASWNVSTSTYYHRQKLVQVDIGKLKEFAFNNIPKDNPLREIILSERDLLDSTEFLVKIDVWLRLASLVLPSVSKVRLSNTEVEVKQ
jgi:hypothetical protein